MSRLLITGASGLLGANLVLEARSAGHQVSAAYFRNPIKAEEVSSYCVDLREEAETQMLARIARPDWIIHCAAATDVDRCEADRDMAWRLNVAAPASLARAGRAVGARLVYISTDSVFDGTRAYRREDEGPNPLNVYAASKLAGERAVLEEIPDAVIVRTNIYGWNMQKKHSLAEWILEGLRAGRVVYGFPDVFCSPILVNDLSRILLRMVGAGLSGVYHVAGAERCNKYELALAIARLWGFDEGLIHSLSFTAAPWLVARRPPDTSLDVSKITRALGVSMPDVRTGLRRWKSLHDDGFADQLRKCLQGGV
jgi:dTDP-4-dehydrorhamnose reductase